MHHRRALARRTKHRLVYRATIAFKGLAPLCVGLQQKKTVSLFAARGAVNETVAVIKATRPCRTMATAPAGNTAPETFQILVKKSSVPLANSFTVVSTQRHTLPPCLCPWPAKPPGAA